MKLRLQQLIPIVALGCALPAMAAREFTPQAGLWMIPSENNGQPGRGFSLDVQGNTAFLQVFNYEKSGAATFHTAVGKLDDAASMTVPLLRFKGGRFFGGPAQDAVEDGNAGNVTVKFNDGLNGTVQFPGESEQPIARFLVNEKLPFWWTQTSDSPPSDPNGSRGMMLIASGNNGTRYVWNAVLTMGSSSSVPYKLKFYPTQPYATPYLSYAPNPLDCSMDQSTQVLDCVTAKVIDPSEQASANALQIHRLRMRFLARDIVGELQPEAEPSTRLVLNGTTFGSYSSHRATNGLIESSRKTYSMFDLLADECNLSCVLYGDTHLTLLPTSGAWMIESENSGKPGRGIFLDVQEYALVVQTSDYLASGEATFHMGAGVLKDASRLSGNTTAAMPLMQFAGGRYFGGPAQTGHETVNAGELKLSFAPRLGKESKELTDFATGEITLPGEATQRIKRLPFEPATQSMENMLGEYLVRWEKSEGFAQYEEGWLRLTRVEGAFAKNDDGTVQCKRLAYTSFDYPFPQYTMTCVWNLSPDAPFDLVSKWWRRVEVAIHPFNREPYFYPYAMRTRDRHGNWLGLGKVNLPGLAIPQNN